MTITVPGYTTITGNPVALLRLMADAQIFDEPLTMQEYIDKITDDAKRCLDIDLHVTGNTCPEKAESLLRELAANNMITIEEDAR